MKYKKEQIGIYNAKHGNYEIRISRYENKWFADIELDGEFEANIADCKSKKEAQQQAANYLGV